MPGPFELVPLLLLLVLGAAGLVLGRRRSRTLAAGLEAAGLALLGGLLARTFTWLLLAAADGSPQSGVLVGWVLFLWPGAVDSVAGAFGARPVTAPGTLLWVGTAIGGLAGLSDGIWRIHDWRRAGVLTFVLDHTWGLIGTTNGLLLHLLNFTRGEHGPEERTGAHRYRRGFAPRPGFVFTQGSVISSCRHGPGTGIYAHEMTHVWQNRAFGPLFTLTYLLWMAVMVLPGLVAGLVLGVGARAGIEQWCYFNCPWEAWSYRAGHRCGEPPRTGWGRLVWSDRAVLLASVAFFGLLAALAGLALLGS